MIELSVSTIKEVAGVVPNKTFVAPVKFEPVMETAVPPLTVPLVGLMLDTAGVVGKAI